MLMKQHRLFITLLLTIIAVQAVFSGDKVVVIGQNVENFYYSLDLEGNSDAKRQAKMDAIINAYFPSDNSVATADIYAFCEVECSDEIMQYIASSFKAKTGLNFQASLDGMTYNKSYYTTGLIKCGFVYNADKIEAVSDNVTTAIDYAAYTERMRMQTFKSKASGECFTLSMNHFKAFSKNQSEWDNDREKRLNNAIALLKGLNDADDPDILIMGDLNSEMGEACLTKLVDAGYEEQLIKYAGATAWTHCYGGGEIIDHVFANNTMAQQVTDVEVKAANYCSVNIEDQAFSDHNFYVVTLDLKHIDEPTYKFAKTTSVKAGGQYLIAANLIDGLKIAQPIATNYSYGYLYTQNATDEEGVITLQNMSNAFTLEDADDGKFYIKDSNNRYFWQQPNGSNYYYTISVTEDKNTAHKYTVTKQDDGTFKILNTTSNYYIYGTVYNNTTPEFGMTKYTSLYSPNCLPWLYEYDPSSTTGISTVNVYRQPTITRKSIVNGRLIIVTGNGQKYTAAGIEIR